MENNEKILSKIKCEICGKHLNYVTGLHLKTHGITFDEYKEQFPDAPSVSEDYRRKLSKSKSGENSPMFGRTGKRHPKYGKHHSEDTKQKISDSHADVSGKNNPNYGKTGKNNPNYGRTGDKCPNYGKTGKNAPNWKGGISFEPYCEKFDNDLKERVREFFNRCCYICGKNEVENGQKLSVHHVNYDKMVCCNDVKPLFVPLCKKCHTKTLKDRKYWEEFFTVSLEYLTNGECFIKKNDQTTKNIHRY